MVSEAQARQTEEDMDDEDEDEDDDEEEELEVSETVQKNRLNRFKEAVNAVLEGSEKVSKGADPAKMYELEVNLREVAKRGRKFLNKEEKTTLKNLRHEARVKRQSQREARRVTPEERVKNLETKKKELEDRIAKAQAAAEEAKKAK